MTAWIGLGANLGEAAETVERAFERLGTLGSVRARSRLYRTQPWGVRDQPAFVNAAAILETSLQPHDLLAGLQAIERDLGRVPSPRWGPRAIDLDLLFYDDLELSSPALSLPHPRALERAFVLVPLAEIDPRYQAALARLSAGERAEVTPLSARTEPPAMTEQRDGAEVDRDGADWAALAARVREVAAACVQSDLARLRVRADGLDVDLRRSQGATAGPPALPEPAGTAALPTANGRTVARVVDELAADVVGVFRFSRPAVALGVTVAPGRELGAVESLGIRNPVTVRAPGTVSGIYVEDGQPVDYGHPLFAIER